MSMSSVILVDAVGATCHRFITRSWPGSGASASTGSWHLSVLLPRVCVWSLRCPWPWPTFDLQHELKWFLLPHLWHFLPNAGHSLYACVVLHLLQGLLVLPLCDLLAPFELPYLSPFFPHLKLSIALMVVSWAIPLFDLWRLKSFMSSHVPWLTEVVLHTLCLLTSFLTGPTSWLQSAWSHEIIARFYVPVFLPPCTGISQLDSLYIDLAYLQTHHHLTWYHCRFYRCGSSKKLTPLGSLQWPEILPLDPAGLPHLLRWVMYSISWNLPYRDSLQLLQTIFPSWCLTLSTQVWSDLSTPQMQVVGHQHSSWTAVVEIWVVHLPLCCNETKNKGLEMNQAMFCCIFTAEMSAKVLKGNLYKYFPFLMQDVYE